MTLILRCILGSILILALLPLQMVAQTNYDVSAYREEAQQLIDAALQDGESFERLTYFADTFGHRFSGSDNLERSIDWILKEMKEQNLDRVTSQQVMVPHWVRGKESASLIAPRKMDLPMLGLGGSVGTPPEGIRANVLVVNSFDELKAKAEQVKDKIVLYNVPFTMYSKTCNTACMEL